MDYLFLQQPELKSPCQGQKYLTLVDILHIDMCMYLCTSMEVSLETDQSANNIRPLMIKISHLFLLQFYSTEIVS